MSGQAGANAEVAPLPRGVGVYLWGGGIKVDSKNESFLGVSLIRRSDMRGKFAIIILGL